VRIAEPVCISLAAGPWAGRSEGIERMTHISSACSWSFGKISEISRPDLPHFLNSKGVGKITPPWPEALFSAKAFMPGL
jgi:hypothetical protein